jgi:DNA-binding transcriptional MerR regulator
VKSAAARQTAPTARYRMRDLCEASGLPRQAIHFYIQEGLLPQGEKTGRNMAWYGEEHLRRLKLIRRLQEERFLPLKAIRAVLDGGVDHFSAAQRSLLGELKARLSPEITGAAEVGDVDLATEMRRLSVTNAQLDSLVKAGLVAIRPRRRISVDDLAVIETYAAMRALGFSEKNGFQPSDLAVYAEAMSSMFAKEAAMLTSRLGHLPADEVGPMFERALPLIHAFVIRYHQRLVRNLFASL